MNSPRSASQTIGPFFEFALPWRDGPHAAAPGTAGAFWIEGQLLDGNDAPIDDGLIETWQIGPSGVRGFARCGDADGGAGSVSHAPQLAASVFARGLLKRAVTRIYFPDEAAANATDPALQLITDADARATLIAAPTERGYRFDIRMQGALATVFFDV